MTASTADTGELEPCPFCGGKGVIRERLEKWHTLLLFRVQCESCVAESIECSDIQTTVARWNRRTPIAQREQPPFRNVDSLGRGDHNPPIGSLDEAIKSLSPPPPQKDDGGVRVDRDVVARAEMLICEYLETSGMTGETENECRDVLRLLRDGG